MRGDELLLLWEGALFSKRGVDFGADSFRFEGAW